MPGSRPGVGTTAHRVVESHIDGLLGEQIFPVSPGAGPDEPHLLALDASGAPVVVELVARLDEAALSRFLDHAGAAGRMTRGQLAALYRGGPQAFQRDVAEFYDSVPVTRSHGGRAGARLIVICQEADEDVLNAVDFLRQPSMPVEVLRLGVVHGADGRRFVDVSPLVIHPASAPDRPQVVQAPAPAALPAPEGVVRLAAPDHAAPAVQPSPGARGTFDEGIAVGYALTGKLPVVVQDPRPVERLDPVPLPGVPTGMREVPQPEAAPRPEEPAPDPAPAPRRRSRRDRFSARPEEELPELPAAERYDVVAPADDPLAWRPEQAWNPASGEDPIPVPPLPEGEAIAFGEVFTGVSTPLDRDWDGATGDTAIAPAPWEAPFEPPRLHEPPAPEPWWQPAAPEPQHWDPPATPIVLDEDADGDLVALAASIGVPTLLVWERPRRGQRFDAVLHPDGTIELPDGGRYRHPDIAASAVSGSYTADGWSVWRLSTPSGPTLTEEFRARFA
ncbi:hypothetical protein [Xylanimonas sp. McL0601]|uniref:restriction system modified-DNA reader domain-containing protein n=1 Tax=Xylanimonas sp. McL0601 TaxID=3414739 RepID=UPI003CEC8EC4